jgi:hypothetical protein
MEKRIQHIKKNGGFASIKDLKEALTLTFSHRETKVEDRLLIYEEGYKLNSQTQIQWSSFLERNKLNAEKSFAKVIE